MEAFGRSLEKTPTEDALLHFKKNQHDLYNLWRAYQNLNLNISEETSKKLGEYFENINVFDKNSDLWRYPLFEEDYDSREHYVGRALSYIEAAKLTYSNELSIEEKEYPLFYLLRQGIELLLKDYLASNFKEVPHHHHIGFAKQGTGGKVISDLRCRVSPYRQCDLNIIGEMLKQIDKLDREGDRFRYPSSLSFASKNAKTDRKIDIDILYSYVISIDEYFEYLDYLFLFLAR